MEETSPLLFFVHQFALFFTTSSFASVLATGHKEKQNGRPRNEAMVILHLTHHALVLAVLQNLV